MPRTRTFSFVSIPRLEIVDVVLRAGFDGVLIDLEHGAITMHDVPAMVAAADALDGETLVRVSSSHSDSVGKVLDVGVGGIVVPHVGTADAAAEVAAAARFSGERGFNPFVRAGSWGSDPDFASRADASVEVVCMIEGAAGVQHAGEIMRTDGVTGVFLGPYDLSVACGRPGDTKHPDVVKRLTELADEMRKDLGDGKQVGPGRRPIGQS